MHTDERRRVPRCEETDFSFTMPSEAAKKARTCETKYRSLSLSLLSQSWRSLERSTSSAVQKDAIAFLYICQICVIRENRSRHKAKSGRTSL